MGPIRRRPAVSRQRPPQPAVRWDDPMQPKKVEDLGVRLLVPEIGLIDDLYDSGATLEEAAKVLSRGGAASLIVLTLTKTIHSDA